MKYNSSLILFAVLAVVLMFLLWPSSSVDAQWGLIRAAQIEDVFLRNDGDDASSGGLVLGGGLDVAGDLHARADVIMDAGARIAHPAGFVRYYTASEVEEATVFHAVSTLYAVPRMFNGSILIPLRLESASYGGELILDQITVYALDTGNSAYITRLALECADPADGLITPIDANNTDLGSGTTGALSGTILSEDAGPISGQCHVIVETAGMAGMKDIRFTGMKVEYHRS